MMSTDVEKYYERLVTGLHLKALQRREKVTLNDLIGSSLPEVFLASAKLFARKTFQQETPLALNGHGRYDFCGGNQLKEQMEPLRETLLLATLLTDDEVGQLSEFSARLQLDIYLRPRQALTDLLFKSKNEKSIEDIVAVCEGFDADRPFIQKVILMAESWQSETISRDQFDDMTQRIEHKVYKETPVSALLTDINLLLDFQTQILDDDRLLQTQILLAMLQNRNLQAMFEEFCNHDFEKKFWAVDEVERGLERFLLVGPLESSQNAARDTGQGSSFEGELPEQGELGDWDSFNGFERQD